MLPSLLPLMSLTFVEDELGVAAFELLGDRASPPRRVEPDSGEAVPEVESFFFEVFESFALDNCSCYIHGQRSFSYHQRHRAGQESSWQDQHTTRCRKPFMFATCFYSTSFSTLSRGTRSKSTSNPIDLLQPIDRALHLAR